LLVIVYWCHVHNEHCLRKSLFKLECCVRHDYVVARSVMVCDAKKSGNNHLATRYLSYENSYIRFGRRVSEVLLVLTVTLHRMQLSRSQNHPGSYRNVFGTMTSSMKEIALCSGEQHATDRRQQHLRLVSVHIQL